MGGYRATLNDDVDLLPSVLINKAANNPTQVDFNVRAEFFQFLFGTTYRTDDALAILTGYTILDFLEVTYSYDILTSALSNYSKGSHEMMIRYKIFYNDLSKKLYQQRQ